MAAETSKKATKKTGAKAKQAAKAPEKKPEGSKGKIAAWIAAATIVLAVVLVLNVGNLAKVAVEKIASETLGVPVSVASLDVSLQDKQVQVKGVRVQNPEGYKGSTAIEIAEIQIAARNISQAALDFERIRVSGTQVNLEVTEQRTNLSDIRRNIDARASKDGQYASGQPVKVMIEELLIQDAALEPVSILGGDSVSPVMLPDMRLVGIGKQENGILASQAIAQITEHVMIVAMQTSYQSGLLRGMDAESLRGLQDSIGISGGFMDQVRDLGGRVKGIFGN